MLLDEHLVEAKRQFSENHQLCIIYRMWENVVWPRPGAHPGARQQKGHLGTYNDYRDQMRFFNKTSDITETGCYRSETITSTIILF